MKILMKNAVEAAKQNGGGFYGTFRASGSGMNIFGFTRWQSNCNLTYNQSNKRHLKDYSAKGVGLFR